MTCTNHAWPIAGCVGCLGRWDRAMAEAVLADLYGIEAATLRAALAEVDRLRAAGHDAVDAWSDLRIADLDEAATTYATMRAEIDALRCGDVGAFHDGELDEARADAFREHLGRCERCQRNLQDITIIAAIASSPPREPTDG